MAELNETPDDRIRNEQRKRGARIVTLCVIVVLVSLYLLIDVRLQGWGQPFHDVKTDDSVWLQWLFAGLTGTALSQLWLAAVGFEKIKVTIPRLRSNLTKLRRDIQQVENLELLTQMETIFRDAAPIMEKDNFIEKTPTFLLNFLRGPIIVLVILFTLTHVSLAASLIPESEEQTTTAEVSSSDTVDEAASTGEGDSETGLDETTNSPSSTEITSDSAADLKGIPLGIAIDLRSAHPDVIVILAFVLGYYQKLAITVLDNIARKIFGNKIWEQAYPDTTSNEGNDGEDTSQQTEK